LRVNGSRILESPRLCRVLEGEVPELWRLVKPEIERAIANGCQWNMQEIHDRITDGRMQLWIYGEHEIDAVLVTRCTDHCLLLACAGYNMHRWLRHLSLIEVFARQMDCQRMELHGRRGWQKVLKGYRHQGTDELGLHVLTKDLT